MLLKLLHFIIIIICTNLLFIIRYFHLYTELVNSLSLMLSVNEESWQMGTSKIFIKTELNEKLEHLLWLRYTSASRMIQKFYHFCHRRTVTVQIQATYRMYCVKRIYKKQRKVIIKLQSLLRMAIIKQMYIHFVRIIIKIQSYYRGRRCRKEFITLRNPYRHLSYDELNTLYNQLETSLETFMVEQNFQKCEEIQYQLNDLKVTRSQFYATNELILPLSRKDLELYLIELNYAVNYSKLHYSENITYLLTQQIKHLQAEKSNYPTVEEITSLLNIKKKELELALNKKEFKKCTELRDQIQKFENALEVATFTGKLHYLK